MIAFVGASDRRTVHCITGCCPGSTAGCSNPDCPNRDTVYVGSEGFFVGGQRYIEISRPADPLCTPPPEPKRPNNRHERRRQAALSRRRT